MLGRRKEGGIRHFISRAADMSAHPWPGAGGQERPQGALQPPPPLSPHPHPPWPTDRHGDARCGATVVGQGPAGIAEGWGGLPAPAREGWSRQPGAVPGLLVLLLTGLLGDECPEAVIPEAGADAEACGQGRERSAHGATVTVMPLGTGRSSLDVNRAGATVTEPGRAGSSRHEGHMAGLGRHPAECKADAGRQRCQGRAAPLARLAREERPPSREGGRAERAGGAGWAMPPAPWMIPYLDGALSPRKPGKGQVEQALGWGRRGADWGSPGPHPVLATPPRKRRCRPGTHTPAPRGLCLCLGIPRRHRCPPASWTAAFAPTPPQLPILNPGAEKHAPRGHSTSDAASPVAQRLGFPVLNPKHQIFPSVSCTRAGRPGSHNACPRRHAWGGWHYLLFGVRSGA